MNETPSVRAVNDRVAYRVEPGGGGLAPRHPASQGGESDDGSTFLLPLVPGHGEKARITPSRLIFLPDESLSQTTQSNHLAPGGSEWAVIFRGICRKVFSWHHLDLGRKTWDFEIGAFKVLQTWTILLVEGLHREIIRGPGTLQARMHANNHKHAFSPAESTRGIGGASA